MSKKTFPITSHERIRKGFSKSLRFLLLIHWLTQASIAFLLLQNTFIANYLTISLSPSTFIWWPSIAVDFVGKSLLRKWVKIQGMKWYANAKYISESTYGKPLFEYVFENLSCWFVFMHCVLHGDQMITKVFGNASFIYKPEVSPKLLETNRLGVSRYYEKYISAKLSLLLFCLTLVSSMKFPEVYLGKIVYGFRRRLKNISCWEIYDMVSKTFT